MFYQNKVQCLVTTSEILRKRACVCVLIRQFIDQEIHNTHEQDCFHSSKQNVFSFKHSLRDSHYCFLSFFMKMHFVLSAVGTATLRLWLDHFSNPYRESYNGTECDPFGGACDVKIMFCLALNGS